MMRSDQPPYVDAPERHAHKRAYVSYCSATDTFFLEQTEENYRAVERSLTDLQEAEKRVFDRFGVHVGRPPR